MADALLDNTKCNFWHEIKKVSKSRKTCANVDGVHGESAIVDLFCNKYQILQVFHMV